MEDNKLIIYKNSEGNIVVDAIYKDETLWLSQKGMSKVFECSTDNISLHLKHIFEEKELDKKSVTEKCSLTADDEKRFYQRKLTKQGNYTLQRVASAAGVKNMVEFHNAGYKGLYNGETSDDIFKRKKLRYREDILDNMNEDELVANLFRINQTKQKLLKDNVQGEKEAKDVHYEVGKKVRKAIADIGGMMSEEMPTH